MKPSDLPAVHELLTELGAATQGVPHEVVVAEIRAVLGEARRRIQADPFAEFAADAATLAVEARARIEALRRPSLRRVLNATGVVLHTNLGRAPLGDDGYSNLEYDLAAGRRGKRDVHAGALLERLLGVPAIVVNNNAAAVYLVLNELAAGGEAVVSRGELIEIGDGFRIPDIMARSGAILREVGTANRTSVDDYAAAINERTRLLMMVHPSNFRIEGFTAKPSRRELAALARGRGVPLYEDLGSGCLADLRPFGIDEPRVQECLGDGVSLVSFSGDKLLGGPQAGIIAGEPGLVARLRRNPMFRALRVDKLILTALEETLRNTLLERWDEVPAIRMIRAGAAELRKRAERIAAGIPGATVSEGKSVIGGGSTPEQSLSTWLVRIAAANVPMMERRLRSGDPAVVARIEDERIVLDARTIAETEEAALIAAVNGAMAGD